MKLNDIIAECERLSDKLCVHFDLPVRINNRLTRTLGRVCFEGGSPYVMEISGPMLKTCTDETIIQTVRHEWAHWYAWRTDGVIHGHDQRFRDICDLIDCKHNRAKNKVERLEGAEPIYKYTVSCKCGKTWNYSRKGNVIKNIDLCYCPHCHGELTVKQNF
jgi:predicted SprT family Zn-dependent metalloprotease